MSSHPHNIPMRHTVYPKKYAHGFGVHCFVVVMQSFTVNSHEVFIHIHQGCFAGTGAIVRLPQCQWSKPDGYGKISQCITTTKHSKAKTVCIFLGIYCTIMLLRLIMINMQNCSQLLNNYCRVILTCETVCFSFSCLNVDDWGELFVHQFSIITKLERWTFCSCSYIYRGCTLIFYQFVLIDPLKA